MNPNFTITLFEHDVLGRKTHDSCFLNEQKSWKDVHRTCVQSSNFLSERAFDAMFQAMATLDIFQKLTS